MKNTYFHTFLIATVLVLIVALSTPAPALAQSPSPTPAPESPPAAFPVDLAALGMNILSGVITLTLSAAVPALALGAIKYLYARWRAWVETMRAKSPELVNAIEDAVWRAVSAAENSKLHGLIDDKKKD